MKEPTPTSPIRDRISGSWKPNEIFAATGLGFAMDTPVFTLPPTSTKKRSLLVTGTDDGKIVSETSVPFGRYCNTANPSGAAAPSVPILANPALKDSVGLPLAKVTVLSGGKEKGKTDVCASIDNGTTTRTARAAHRAETRVLIIVLAPAWSPYAMQRPHLLLLGKLCSQR